jgi:hypothetical protein
MRSKLQLSRSAAASTTTKVSVDNNRMKDGDSGCSNQRFGCRPPSINILILDSLSRFDFLTHLNYTTTYLEELGARGLSAPAQVFQFHHFGIVGTGTYNALPALLAGRVTSKNPKRISFAIRNGTGRMYCLLIEKMQNG